MLKTWDGQIVYFGAVLPKDLNFKKQPKGLDKWKDYGRLLRQAKGEIDLVKGKTDEEHAEKTGSLTEYEALLAWALGDWLVEGVKGGLKPRVLKGHVREVLGKKCPAWGTLSNYMTVSRAVDFSRRREDLPYSIHLEVAKYTPEEQEEYLKKAQEDSQRRGQTVSVRDFKKMVDASQRLKMTMDGRAPAAAEQKPLLLKIGVSEGERNWLREIGRAKGLGYNAASALRWMAGEYAKEHKELLKAELEAYKALEETEKQEAQKRLDARLREWNSPEAVAARQAKEAEKLRTLAERDEFLKAKMAEGKSLQEAIQMWMKERRAALEAAKVAAQESPSPVTL